MKKTLLLIVAIVSVLHASAQDVNSLQDQSGNVSIESLSLRLNKLQHDYDFMYCDYELNKLVMDLKDLKQSIDIISNGILINFYNNKYDRALYNSYVESYDSECALLDYLKDKIEATRKAVNVKMASSRFTDSELGVIVASYGLIEQLITSVEKALNYKHVAINAYRSKR